MAIDKRLQIYDEQGNLVDYDILASDVKFQPDGKDLPTKLAEMDDAIEDAGSGDGTVTGVKVNGTTHEPNDQGVVDIGTVITQQQDISGLATKTELAGKVDKNGTDSLMTAAEHTKLGNLPTADQLATQMNAKANDNAVVKTISVNGGEAQTPTNGNVDINVEGSAGEDGITPHIGQNGHWYIGETDTGINATGNDGQSITDADLVIGNALNGQGDVLGMQGAMRIKSNLDAVQANLVKLYNKLANMAFWDAEDQADAEPVPTLLDWSVPKVTVTLDKTYLSANAMITDASDQEITGTSVSVDEGSGLTLKIKPRNGYALSAASATIGGVSQTLTESNGVYTLVLDSVTEAITIAISATAVVARSVTLNLTGCTLVSGPSGIIDGGGGTFVFAEDTNYNFQSAQPSVEGADVVSWDSSTGELVIDNVDDDVTITVICIVDFMLLVGALSSYDNKLFNPLPKRACIVVDRTIIPNPNTWTQSDFSPNPYSMMPIPEGASTIRITCNAGYQIVAYVFLNNMTSVDPGWQGQSYTIDLTQYPSHIYLGINLKTVPEAAFPNVTLEDIGFTLEFS